MLNICKVVTNCQVHLTSPSLRSYGWILMWITGTGELHEQR